MNHAQIDKKPTKQMSISVPSNNFSIDYYDNSAASSFSAESVEEYLSEYVNFFNCYYYLLSYKILLSLNNIYIYNILFLNSVNCHNLSNFF